MYLSIYGTGYADRGPEQLLEQSIPVRAPQQRFRAALGVRHEPNDVSVLVADAGDVGQRSVRVGLGGRRAARVAVAEYDLSVLLDLREGVRIGDPAAFAVTDRHTQDLPREARGPRRAV